MDRFKSFSTRNCIEFYRKKWYDFSIFYGEILYEFKN